MLVTRLLSTHCHKALLFRVKVAHRLVDKPGRVQPWLRVALAVFSACLSIKPHIVVLLEAAHAIDQVARGPAVIGPVLLNVQVPTLAQGSCVVVDPLAKLRPTEEWNDARAAALSACRAPLGNFLSDELDLVACEATLATLATERLDARGQR